MRLILTPVRMDERLTATVAGDVLTLNGVALDFGPLPSGGLLPQDAISSPWIAGDVTRDDEGSLSVPVILPHGWRADPQTLFPDPIDAVDGVVSLPAYEVQNEA